MGIIGKHVGKLARKALLVAAIYGGKQIAAKVAGRVIKAVSKKAESAKSARQA